MVGKASPMTGWLRLVGSLAIMAMLVGGPLWYRSVQGRNARNFRTVEEGVLYRCGQLPLGSLKKLVWDYQIKSIVNLRDGVSADDMAEEKWARAEGLNFVRIPYRKWHSETTAGPVPAAEGLEDFYRVMDDPKNHPVLVHCYAGIHRTGAHCAVYRIAYNGWSSAEAVEEMRAFGYDFVELDEDVYHFLKTYHRSAPSSRPIAADERNVTATPTSRTSDAK